MKDETIQYCFDCKRFSNIWSWDILFEEGQENFNFFSLFVTIIKKYIESNKRSFLSNLELLNTVVPIITLDDDAIVQNLKIVFRPKRIKIDLNDKSNREKRKQEI